MVWLRVDDRFTEHRKLLQLPRQHRWTWMELLCYAARQNQDGHIPTRIQDAINHATPSFLQACEQTQLLDPVENGWRIHDWLKYNPRDPTNALRQQRHRNRRNAPVTPETVTPNVTHVTPPATRVPDPNPKDNEDKSSSSSTHDDELDKQLQTLGVSARCRQQALHENPQRVQACLDAARRNGRNPAAYFAELLTSGEWPLESVRDERVAAVIDVNDAAERFLAGVGWDESFDAEAVREELRRIEGSTRTAGRLDLDRMMARWRELRSERFPEVPA